MEFIKEEIDEKTGDVVLTFEGTEEEMAALDALCKREGKTLDELATSILEDMVNNPEEAFKWIKEHRTDKCAKGTPGSPIFDYGDKVGFYITKDDKEYFQMGTVEIIDANGTFEQNEEPSYDILVESFTDTGRPCLMKHIVESHLYDIREKK